MHGGCAVAAAEAEVAVRGSLRWTGMKRNDESEEGENESGLAGHYEDMAEHRCEIADLVKGCVLQVDEGCFEAGDDSTYGQRNFP